MEVNKKKRGVIIRICLEITMKILKYGFIDLKQKLLIIRMTLLEILKELIPQQNVMNKTNNT